MSQSIVSNNKLFHKFKIFIMSISKDSAQFSDKLDDTGHLLDDLSRYYREIGIYFMPQNYL
jgi:hypothetical protein